MYNNAGAGLKLMFWAQIANIASLLFALFKLDLLVIVIGIACSVVSFVGLYMAAKDDEGYKLAMILTIANVVLSLLTKVPVVGFVFSLAKSIVSLLILYYVCNTTAKILNSIGASGVAGTAHAVWIINLICTVVSVCCTILMLIPIINILAAIVMMLVGIASIVAGIMYLVFLFKGGNILLGHIQA